MKYYCGNCETVLDYDERPSQCPQCDWLLNWMAQATRGVANVKYVHAKRCQHESTYYPLPGKEVCTQCGSTVR